MVKVKAYYKLYFSTFAALLKSSIDWRAVVLLVLSFAFGAIGSYWWKGNDFMIEQTVTYITYSLLPLGLVALVYVLLSLIQAPVILYTEEKRKADKSSWNDIIISYKEIREGNEVLAYRIKVENSKVDMYYFFVELNYLAVDGKPLNYKETHKRRILLWASGGVFNLQDGVALNPRDNDVSRKIGFWELLRVVGINHENKYAVVFCEYDEIKCNQLPIQNVYVLSSVEGEVKLYGTYIHHPISTGVCGSGKSYGEVIRGDFIYKFRINIINGKPRMAIFEKGPFEYHPDYSEIHEATNEVVKL